MSSLPDEARTSSSAALRGSTEEDRRRSEKLRQKERKMQEIGHMGEAAADEEGGLSLKAAIRDSKKRRQQ